MVKEQIDRICFLALLNPATNLDKKPMVIARIMRKENHK